MFSASSTIHTQSPVYKSVMAHLDTFEAAEWLGLKEATLRDWRSDQKGPPYIEISSRCIRYALEDLIKWRNERRHTPSVQAVVDGFDVHDRYQRRAKRHRVIKRPQTG
jgi:predicted DNA-binding transcriptional regulator AlpA